MNHGFDTIQRRESLMSLMTKGVYFPSAAIALGVTLNQASIHNANAFSFQYSTFLSYNILTDANLKNARIVILPPPSEKQKAAAIVDLSQKVVTRDIELETIFKGLVKIWRDSSGGLSSTSRKFAHPTYKAILRLGPEVVPLILVELQQRPDWWFEALESLTKQNPAKATDSFEQAVSAWIQWGKDNHII